MGTPHSIAGTYSTAVRHNTDSGRNAYAGLPLLHVPNLALTWTLRSGIGVK